MATPAQIIPKLEGMVSFQIGSGDGGSIQGSQTVATWVNMVKWLLGQPSYRYLTDLQFVLNADVDSTGEVIDTGATHLIAGLIEVLTTFPTDAEGFAVYTDADSNTLDAAAALDNTDILVIHLADVTTTGVSEFYPWIQLAGTGAAAGYSTAGIALTTGLTVAVDGDDGTEVGADAARIWTLYRA